MTSGEISIVFGEHSLTAKGGESFLHALYEKWWAQIDLIDVKNNVMEGDVNENIEMVVKNKKTPKKKIIRNKATANNTNSDHLNVAIDAIKKHPDSTRVSAIIDTQDTIDKVKLVCYLADQHLSVVMMEDLLAKVFKSKITSNALNLSILRYKRATFEFDVVGSKPKCYKLNDAGVTAVETFISEKAFDADK